METIVDKNLRGSQVTEYGFGIEEEYFVVGRRTDNIKAELSQTFMRAASKGAWQPFDERALAVAN